MLVSRSIPTLINGVSQQPDSLRLPTQAEAQSNYHPSVVEGLSDRPPTQHIAQLYSGAIGDAYPHIIDRDATERYVVLLRNGDLTVHDLDGVVKTVNFPDGKTYLNTATPSVTMKVITVSDYTFILNTSKVPALDGAVTASRNKEALIFVKQGHYGSDYKVFINGIQQAIKTTSTTSVSDIATNLIAEDLRADLVANLGGGWTISRYGSVIHISANTGDFYVRVEDSQGGASLLAFKDTVQTFTSLPAVAPTNFQIKVIGSAESEAEAYHVKFVPATAGETFGEGSWEETVGMGVQATISPTNMPHLLIRNGDGTFTFQKATWTLLTVGDALTAPAPSFIGKPITDVFFFKNRLGLLAGDAEVYSEVSAPFNFWRTTVTTQLDSDPIDYHVSHTKVPNLKNAVPFAEKLLLFSEKTQFVAQGTPTFTSSTIQTDPTTDFDSRVTCKPIGLGKNAYFVFTRGQFDGVREYYIDQTAEVKDAVDITAQVPKYIPAGVFRLIGSSTENIIVALTSGATNKMYLYKFFYVKDEKLQSAWCEVDMGVAGTKVLGGDFVGSVLYLAIQRADGVYLEKMNYAPGATDPNVNFVTHYDRRITEAQCTSVTYNAGFNRTTWILPYQADGTMKIVTRETNPGQEITLTYASGNEVRATGDFTATDVYLGQSYLRSYTFSKFYLREQKGTSETIVTAGRLQIRTVTIVFADTGTFTVTVTQDHRDPSSYVEYRDPQDATFTGRVLGAGSNLLGAVALATGEHTFPVLAENQKVTITITTDSFLPSHILGAEWEGFYHARSRRG